jgi:hypothetical protein
MRTITKVYQVYKLDELSEEAQEKAFKEFCESEREFINEISDNIGTLDEFEKVFPIKIKEWQYDEYGTKNISFKFDYQTSETYLEDLSGIRLMKYIQNNYGHHLISKKTYYSEGNIMLEKKRVSRILYINDGCPLTGSIYDITILEPIFKFLKNPLPNMTFEKLMKACLNAWLDASIEEMKYILSLENFKEVCASEDYEFLESGEMYHGSN